jgi:hypothetical protein
VAPVLLASRAAEAAESTTGPAIGDGHSALHGAHLTKSGRSERPAQSQGSQDELGEPSGPASLEGKEATA